MIKRKEDMETEVRHHMRGGDGDVILTHFMTEDESYGVGRLFAKVTLNPGCGIGEHDHQGEYESFYIISGEAVVTDNGEDYTLYTGDFHQCRDGGKHAIVCKGDEPCEFIAMIVFVPQK